MARFERFRQTSEASWFAEEAYIVVIPQIVKDILLQHRQLHAKSPEAGGLIYGVLYERGVVLTGVTAPMPLDDRSRYHFHRRDPKHLETVEREYEITRGHINLLGEWHTHPQKNPSPSTIDTRQWREIDSARSPLGLNSLFMIQGTQELWVGGTSSVVSSN